MVPSAKYDRRSQDVGNIILFEHLNLCVPDFDMAVRFYVLGLCMTRDPYYMVGTNVLWLNNGYQQIHLLKGNAQVFRGETTLLVPDIQPIADNLKKIAPGLAGTRFDWLKKDGVVSAVCPWGNHYRIMQAGDDTHRTRGIPHLRADIPSGAAAPVADFYESVLQAKVDRGLLGAGEAVVQLGPGQTISFKESGTEPPDFDGHHICVYLANLSPSYQWLLERSLVTSEDNTYQYRFQDIVDPNSGHTLYKLEHEVRGLYHPMYMRPLINRWQETPLP
jgi:catechol 2,3-dioxygenase-like lactoylglutathione lyase family enzyme